MDEWQILTLLVLNALCMSNEMQQQRCRWALFVGEGMQLVSQQCELSMDMHAAHSDLIDMLDAWIQMHRCLFQIRTLSEMLFQLTIIKKSLS